MSGNVVVDKMVQSLEILVKIVLLNGIWLLFTVLGLGVLGFFPATAALLAVIRKWLMVGMETSILKTFAGSYKKEFMKANLYGFMIVFYAWVLYVNYQYMLTASGWLQFLLVVGFIATSTLFLLTVTFLFPSLVHFELSFLENLKFSFLLGVTKFYLAISVGIGLAIIYHSFLFIPGIMVWFLPSAIGFIVMALTFQGLKRVPSSVHSPI
ncbi:DUF624 domain-containing protein [Jeotgalibacillus sp. S-D1]|uniref:YesL family protein n=1 Tax=Jeotgalibacillus sp. S-D1 TaxID=2552189 RepID=UPI00105A6C0A|nr:DUF624 domain-containing protein [Jeotgalibacillus sp. S-D1]TDL31102.1 DUF624 domain-containing protein [Jeotgalibacillus sp. S-D1]